MNASQTGNANMPEPQLPNTDSGSRWWRLGHHIVPAEKKEVKLTPSGSLVGICQMKVTTTGRSLWLYGAEIEYRASESRPMLTVLNVPPGACSPVIKLPEPADEATRVSLFFVAATCGDGPTEIEIWGSPDEGQVATV